MIKNKLNFESGNLAIDWIGFNIQGFVNKKQVERIANYLFQNFGFNATFAVGLDGKEEYLFKNLKNNYQVSFRLYRYSDIYWDGIKIDFSGNNAAQVYNLIKEQKFDWNIFQLSNLSLSRLDLCYFRERQEIDQKDELETFFSNSISKLVNTRKKNSLNFDQSTKGYILRIGNRKSSNFYRIYQTKTGLRFELEIKKNLIKQLSDLLFCYDIEQFEKVLTKHFYSYSRKVLTLNDCYTDWLIKYLRKNEKPINLLVTSYFKEKKTNPLSEDIKLFTLLQLLTFSRSKNYTKVQIYDQSYFLIQFTLKEFLEFSGVRNINQYQRNKFINLFYSFQKTEPLINYFTESHFQSILSFPYVDIKKQGNSWIVKLAISQLLYDYDYPFAFPTTFLIYKNIYDLQIKLKVIEAISTIPLKKVFYTEVFLGQFNVSKSKRSIIKKDIVKVFNQLQTAGIIKNHYRLIKKSQQIQEVNTLTQLLVGQANRIYFYENI